ncbi:MAG: hypothetical protein JWL71_113 [Acidobacteria bacterium]|nr:hypothetical protein [Acidobacteriota bacterium]
MNRDLREASGDRERRYPIRVDVRYRHAGDREWHCGRTENISRSGILIRARHLLAPHTPIEVLLSLPPELGGAADAPVIGRGRVVRADAPDGDGAQATVAAIVAEYAATYVAGNDPRRI